MKETYETNPTNSVRVIVTVQDGTHIKTSNLWISKPMLEDIYKEQGLTAFRQKIRVSLAEQADWATFEIHDRFGFIGGFVPRKSWWRRLFGG